MAKSRILKPEWSEKLTKLSKWSKKKKKYIIERDHERHYGQERRRMTVMRVVRKSVSRFAHQAGCYFTTVVKRADGTVLTGSHDDEFINHWSATGEEHIKTIFNCKNPSHPTYVVELDSTTLHMTWCRFNEVTRESEKGIGAFHRDENVILLLRKFNNEVAAGLSYGGRVELWNVVNDQILRTIPTSSAKVIVELNNGNLATSSSSSSKIFIWSTESCQLLQTLEGHSESVLGLVQLDNDVLVSCSADKTVKMWNIELECCIATLCGHTAAVLAIVKMSNETFVTASTDKTMRGWNDKGQPLFVAHTEAPVGSLCELADGTIAAGTFGCVERWRFPTHE